MTAIPTDPIRDAIRGLSVLARNNPATFSEFVLKDERSGKRIQNGSMHETWHQFVTNNERCVIWASVESGKSQQITIGRTLWELGHDPTKRCLLVSKTKAQAEKFTRPLRHYIENSPELRLVFPKLRPGKRWTDGAFDVAGKEGAAKDFSIEASGLDGNILGARYDWVVIDDLLDWETTRTRYQREKCLDWLRATVFGRLTSDAKVVLLTNAWERDDAAHVFASEGWPNMRSPLIDLDSGDLAWETRWPRSRIDEYRDMNPAEFDRQIMCIPRKPGEQRFREEWLQKCMDNGRGRTLVYEIDEIPPDARVITGVDLGVGTKESNDRTAIVTLMAHDNSRKREVLWMESGRWSAPEIIEKALDQHKRFGSVLWVESNAAQDFLVQFARLEGANVPIRSFTTGRNKWHPSYGVEGIAAEMSAGRWIIPSGRGAPEPEVRAWLDEMRYYDPADHTGDRLMASWIAREGIRMGEDRHRVDGIDVDGKASGGYDSADPAAESLWSELGGMIHVDDDDGGW